MNNYPVKITPAAEPRSPNYEQVAYYSRPRVHAGEACFILYWSKLGSFPATEPGPPTNKQPKAKSYQPTAESQPDFKNAHNTPG